MPGNVTRANQDVTGDLVTTGRMRWTTGVTPRPRSGPLTNTSDTCCAIEADAVEPGREGGERLRRRQKCGADEGLDAPSTRAADTTGLMAPPACRAAATSAAVTRPLAVTSSAGRSSAPQPKSATRRDSLPAESEPSRSSAAPSDNREQPVNRADPQQATAEGARRELPRVLRGEIGRVIEQVIERRAWNANQCIVIW